MVESLVSLDTNYQYGVLILIFEKERGQGLNSENESDNTISDNSEIQYAVVLVNCFVYIGSDYLFMFCNQ